MSHGGLLALSTAFLWALVNCSMAIAVNYLNVHPVASVMQIYIWAGLTMFLIGYMSTKETEMKLIYVVREPLTWVYGFAELSLGLLLMLIYVHITPTEESLLSRLSVPLALLVSFLFLNKKLSLSDIICIFFMAIGLIIIITGFNYSNIIEIILLVTLAAIAIIIRGLAAEFHPEFKRASTVKQRCFIVGIIVLISGLLFSSTIAVLSFINFQISFTGILAHAIPSLKEIFHSPTIIFSFLFGGLLISFTRYLYFRSVALISNTTFLMFAALTPMFTHLIEEALRYMNILKSSPSLETTLIIGGVIVTITPLLGFWRKELPTKN